MNDVEAILGKRQPAPPDRDGAGPPQQSPRSQGADLELQCTRKLRLETTLSSEIRTRIAEATLSCTVWASHRIDLPVLVSLETARARGIRVDIIKDRGAVQARDFVAPWRSCTKYFDASPGKMHVKSVIVDDEWFVVGSINLFDRSMTKDLEAALLSSNPLANASLRAALTTIVEDSRPIDFKLFIYFARNELRVFFLRLLSRLRKSRTIFARTMRLPTEAPEQ